MNDASDLVACSSDVVAAPEAAQAPRVAPESRDGTASAPPRRIAQRVVPVLGVWLQGLVLASWARPGAAHALVLLALGAGLAAATWRRTGAAPAASRSLAMASLGGAGMLVGTWLDWRMGVPDCLCCLFAAGLPPWRAWAALLAGRGTALMVALPLLYGLIEPQRPMAARQAAAAAPGCGLSPSRHRLAVPRIGTALREVIGMAGGMALAAYGGSFAVRVLPGGKLEAGHLIMLAGMWAGCRLVGREGARPAARGARGAHGAHGAR